MTGHIDPTLEAFAAFKDLPRDEPVQMLNLLRLKAEAAYPDARGGTGADAYKTYGKTSGPIFQRVGGQIIWRGQPRITLIGPSDEAWDLAFIAAYPNAHAFMEMVTDPIYQSQAVPHRQAAVADSRLIRMAPVEEGHGFG